MILDVYRHRNASFQPTLAGRKVRWARRGTGKRGGVRVIHYNRLAEGVIYLLLIYAKGIRDDVDAKTLDKVRKTIHGKDEDD